MRHQFLCISGELPLFVGCWLLGGKGWKLKRHSLLNVIPLLHSCGRIFLRSTDRKEWNYNCSRLDNFWIICSSASFLGRRISLPNFSWWSNFGTHIRSQFSSSSPETAVSEAETSMDFDHWFPCLVGLLSELVAIVCISYWRLYNNLSSFDFLPEWTSLLQW